MHGTIESLFRVEWRPLVELAALVPEWSALAERALEPNVFYEPAFALAAAPVFGRNAGAGLVWSRTTPPRLLGLFPARVERRRYGAPLPVLVGWTHPYGPLGTPLVDRDVGEAVIAAWLDHLSTHPQLPNRMLLPFLPAQGPVGRAFDSALAHRSGRSVSFAPHGRALLAPDQDRTAHDRSAQDRSAYVEHAVGRKKLKELRRQLRRLGETGVVTWSIASEPMAVGSALGDFLQLEADGWKGRAGTAARANAEVRAFMETAVPQLARDRKASVARLILDGRTIAALILLQSQDTAWAWKIAYDESAARASPGVQLLLHVTQSLLDDPAVARADSCASAQHPMIDHLWRERLELADRLMRVGTAGSVAFTLTHALETLRRGAIAAAKRGRDLLRR